MPTLAPTKKNQEINFPFILSSYGLHVLRLSLAGSLACPIPHSLTQALCHLHLLKPVRKRPSPLPQESFITWLTTDLNHQLGVTTSVHLSINQRNTGSAVDSQSWSEGHLPFLDEISILLPRFRFPGLLLQQEPQDLSECQRLPSALNLPFCSLIVYLHFSFPCYEVWTQCLLHLCVPSSKTCPRPQHTWPIYVT